MGIPSSRGGYASANPNFLIQISIFQVFSFHCSSHGLINSYDTYYFSFSTGLVGVRHFGSSGRFSFPFLIGGIHQKLISPGLHLPIASSIASLFRSD